MGVLGVNHVAFRPPDVARLNAFYAELLGAEPRRQGGASTSERRLPMRQARSRIASKPAACTSKAISDGRRIEFAYDDRGAYWQED